MTDISIFHLLLIRYRYINKKLSYRKQITRQMHKQYVKSICSNFITLKSRSRVTQWETEPLDRSHITQSN